MKNQEIEARFLDIDKIAIIKILRSLGAEETPEEMIEQIIFYDPDLKWRDIEKRFVRIRKIGGRVVLTYKHNKKGSTVSGVEEVEFDVPDFEKASLVLERIGLIPHHHQQKLRHSFKFRKASLDIDTWPTVPPYIEIEGESEEHIKEIAKHLGLDYSKVITEDALVVLEKYYKVPIGSLKIFRFDKIE